MNNPNLHSRGSAWRKWDLHVHSPASVLNNTQFPGRTEEEKWQNFYTKLRSIAGFSVIGITDYFSIEGYRKVVAEAGLTNFNLILPNVELRILPATDSDRPINLHVIFNPSVVGDLDSKFFSSLEFTYNSEVYKCIRTDLIKLGRKYKNDNSLDEEAAYKAGAEQFKATIEGLRKIFQDKVLAENSIIIVSNSSGDGNSGIQHSSLASIREEIYRLTRLIFSGNPSDRAYFLGQGTDNEEEIKRKYGGLKACVHGSDSHNLENMCMPCSKRAEEGHNCSTSSSECDMRFCWIKADPTFEGLKQIIYEPELRVRVQQDDPSEEETYAKIEKLGVDFPNDLKIKDKESSEAIPFRIRGKQEINFSTNLTCVIGGRGSGKSTLVHILYNLVPGRDTDRLSKVSSPLFDLQLGSKDELGKIRSQTKSDIPSSTEFFLQNEVEKFAKDVGEMSNLIKTRLYGLSAIDDGQKNLQQIENKWKVADVEVEELISAYDEMTRIDQQIVLVKKQKDTLKKQTDVISSKDYKKLQKEIEDIANAISAFDTYEKEYKRVSLEISTLIKSVSRLDWTKYDGQSVLTSLSAELEKKKTEIQASFETATKKHAVADYTTKLNDKKTQLKNFLKEKGLSPENIGEIATATQQIADLDEQIKILQQERIPHQETYDRKENTLQAHKEAYFSYKEVFESVANKLQSDLGNLKFDDEKANISFQFKINDQLLKDTIADFVKSCNTSKISLRADSIQSVLFGNDNIPLSDIISNQSKIVEAVNSSEVADAHTQIIRELIGDTTFVEKLHLRMQHYHFNIKNIQVQTKLGEKLLQNTSFGERCGIVIAIVLVAGTNPIVIDQPEDNLDGKYISKVLVPLIRAQKQKRQIILVTRDANIVIGGDSELILILDKEDWGSVLLPATIENKVVRPKYIWILDGGEIAFKAREAKYCIHKAM
jgi:energy-coupling factor transporter ATP-binding protein EcfA2